MKSALLLRQLVESANQLQGAFVLAKAHGYDDVANAVRLAMFRVNDAIYAATHDVEAIGAEDSTLVTGGERGMA